MSLRKYLLAGGLSSVLILGACNGDGASEEETTEEETTEEAAGDGAAEEETTEEETAEDESGSAAGDVSYSGEYGDYSVVEFGQYTIEPEETEEETTGEETEEEAEETEEPQPTEVVTIEFEFTNNSDVATSPQEAFGLDLAVRQMADDTETPLDNLTMDLPEDFEKSEEVTAADEMVEPGETATAVVAYGPLDTGLETVLQSRENPMAEEESEPLDHTIELEGSDGSEEDTTEEDSEE